MVSMIDRCNDRSTDRSEALRSQPQLVLQDFTQDLSQDPTQEQPLKHCKPFARFENVLLASAASAAIGFFLATSASSFVHSVQQNYSSQTLPQTVIISKVVKRGDTLTLLARRYGNPNTYILEREDQIARANHLTGTMPLFPGQHLQIPVTNPSVIAQIVHASHRPLVASR